MLVRNMQDPRLNPACRSRLDLQDEVSMTKGQTVMGRRALHLFAVLAVTSVLALPASAYVGPGAGLTAIGSFLVLIGTIALMIVGFIWYPVKRMLRSKKATKSDSAAATPVVKDDSTTE